MSRQALYDRIGDGYQLRRQADPRIASYLHAALGDADSVLNIGAGAGSYEPRDRPVVALEPSAVMLAQRQPDAAPAVRGVAEALPFRDGEFGAAMAVLTLHHWTDQLGGLFEMRRVSRGPVIIFGGCDGSLNTSWWLHDYFPAARRLVGGRNYSVPKIESVLGPAITVPVPIPADCLDGFEAAWWQRPHAILDPEVWRATSALSMISDIEREKGMSRLAADLESGAWHRSYGHLLDLTELDLGYRVIICDLSPVGAIWHLRYLTRPVQPSFVIMLNWRSNTLLCVGTPIQHDQILGATPPGRRDGSGCRGRPEGVGHRRAGAQRSSAPRGQYVRDPRCLGVLLPPPAAPRAAPIPYTEMSGGAKSGGIRAC